MSYNLRFASSVSPNSWPERRPLMREVLTQTSPDLIGTQEGVYAQLKDVAADLDGYDWIGLGRNGGNRGEFMAVFYRKTRLEPLEFDHFWLSDNPAEIGSMTWGPTLPRMVTWVKFQDRQTQQQFYFFNTHFDHKVQLAREKSSELVRQRVAALDTTLPVLLAGDFNAAAPTNQAYKILMADKFFHDTWDTARNRSDAITGTFNGFKALQPKGARIDWILTRGDVTVDTLEIVTFSKNGQFPSDHLPVMADLKLGSK
ncbi:MAG: endonuclease/exonuclease/phosphatase family protein [Verrucomicrobia bacterium]|nr:endonuclease/exonuclease/phosphatase family protein [Verrucomicrobiota bacterium]